MGKTEYWVYVNSSLKRAQLHKSTCGSCRFGRHMHGERSTGEDWWGGPFSARDEAWEHAKAEALKLGATPTLCPLCHP